MSQEISDDEVVFFGPLTLKEIKKHLQWKGPGTSGESKSNHKVKTDPDASIKIIETHSEPNLSSVKEEIKYLSTPGSQDKKTPNRTNAYQHIAKTPNRTNAYQHIASPIAAHTKNSPQVPLVKVVHPKKPLPGSSSIPKLMERQPTETAQNKENIVLPQVAYKSAKKTEVEEEISDDEVVFFGPLTLKEIKKHLQWKGPGTFGERKSNHKVKTDPDASIKRIETHSKPNLSSVKEEIKYLSTPGSQDKKTHEDDSRYEAYEQRNESIEN